LVSGIRSKNSADRKTPPEKQEHRLKISFLLVRLCPDELTKVNGINEANRVATNMPTEKKLNHSYWQIAMLQKQKLTDN
jgi:hypothetical protein